MPTWDEITPFTERDTRNKWNAVNVLIGANIAGLILPAVMMFANKPVLEDLLPFHWDQGIKSGWIWQFFTYTFWHPVDEAARNTPGLLWSLVNLVIGSYILHTVGRDLEQEWGWPRFAVFYFATGAYGAVAHAFFQGIGSSDVKAVDFLGPVLSIFLVMGLKSPDRRVLFFFFFPMRLITAALLAIGIVVVVTLVMFHKGVSPVATLGAVAAAFAIHKLEPRIDAWLDQRDQRRAREKFLDEFELKRQVDAILDKINKQGMDSLTSHERRLLKRASRLYSEGQHE